MVCISCGTQLESADGIPSGGVVFTAKPQKDSKVFFIQQLSRGDTIKMCLCDKCIVKLVYNMVISVQGVEMPMSKFFTR